MAHGKKYLEAAKLVDRDQDLPPGRGGAAREGHDHRQVRRHRRGAHPARHRPPPRRPDGPRHGRPPARHRQGRPRRRVRPGREGPGGAPCRRRRGRRARTSSRRSRQAGSSSTSPSPRRTSWARSAGSARSSAAAASCPTRTGTITFDLDRAIREVKGGRVEFKVDKTAIVHVPVGKASFEAEALVANLATLVDAINRAKPAGAKGHYLRTLTIASTMGPGIRVDIPAVVHAYCRPPDPGRRDCPSGSTHTLCVLPPFGWAQTARPSTIGEYRNPPAVAETRSTGPESSPADRAAVTVGRDPPAGSDRGVSPGDGGGPPRQGESSALTGGRTPAVQARLQAPVAGHVGRQPERPPQRTNCTPRNMEGTMPTAAKGEAVGELPETDRTVAR